MWLSPVARKEALRWQAAQDWPADSRLHSAAKFHVTLPFIGEVTQDRVAELAAGCTVPLAPFNLILDRVEVWSRGIIVLAPTAVPDALMDLHLRLCTAVKAQGIQLESRPYRPHLTLARHASGMTPVDIGLPPVRLRVGRYVLAESSAGQYKVIRSYPASVR